MALTVFGAQSANNEVELWGTDGTTARTYLIKNINPGGSANVGNSKLNSGGSLPFAVVGDYAYFSADDGSTGQELWRTDGTTAGTTKVTEFFTNNGTPGDATDDTHGYNPMNIVAANGFIFFVGTGPAVTNQSTSPPVYGIFKYDPATTITTLVSTDVGLTNLIAVGDRIYWTFDHASQGFRSSTGLDGADAGNEPDVDVLTGGTGTLYNAGGTLYHINQTSTSARMVVGATVTELSGEPSGMQGFIHTSSHVYIMTQTGLSVTTIGGTTVTPITAAGLSFDFTYNGFGTHTPGFAALGNKLIFSNNKTNAGVGANTGSEIWITGGATDGSDTMLLKDIVTGSGSSNPHNFITVGDSVLFQATNGNGSVELWKTDGTAAGTVRVETLFAGGISAGTGQIVTPGNFDNMNVIDGVLFFSFDNGVHGTELWRSDGTAVGTAMVRELNPGSFDSGYSTNFPGSGANLGSTGVFVGWSQASGYELFSTDGTPAGTELLMDIAPGGGNSLPTQFVQAGTKAYFSAYSPTAGTELWVTDGTVNGTSMVKDINPGLGSGNPSGMVAVGNKIYFGADNGVNGYELWVSDGTAAGTVLLKDIDPTSSGGFPRSGGPYGFVAAGSKVFFTATTNANGRELWVTDGTSAGTQLTKDIGAGAADANIYSNIVAYNDRVFFQAFDVTDGTELWVSDGTDAGTFMLKNLNTNPGESSNPNDFVLANGLLFFRANGVNPFAGAEVYVSDGTNPGTVALSPTLTNFSQFAVAGNKVFFTAQGASGQELYVTSGAAVTVIDIVAGASGSNATGAVAFGTKVLFTAANTVSNGQELWISDGTLAGTSMVKNLNLNPNASSNPQYITVVGNKAYFVADDGTNGQELWVTDGTSAGTMLVKNIGPGMTGGSISPLRAADNGHLLFLASDGVSGGQELWITDGTNAGTFRVTNVFQPAGSFYSGIGSPTPNGGGTLSGNFASVPGVTLGGGSENLVGTDNDDYLDGLGGNDTLTGGAGHDTLIGGVGADTMNGGLGNDNFYVNSSGDVVNEAAGQGTDRIFASSNYVLAAGVSIETLSTDNATATTAITLIGNELANNVYGNYGNNSLYGSNGNDIIIAHNGDDTLNGGLGTDTMSGGLGNDNFYVNSSSDVVNEAAGQGTDRIFASSNYVLAAGVSIETLSTDSTTGTTAITLIGNELANNVYGNYGNNSLFGSSGNDTLIAHDGDDTLNGGLGTDTMSGGLGNDWFYVNTSTDIVNETTGEGTDRVFSTSNYVLAAGVSVETLSTDNTTATAAITLIGNEFANNVYGNYGNNSLYGSGGNDTLIAHNGNDLLNGGAGADSLTGGTGADTFVFANTAGPGNIDSIGDYSVADDVIHIDNAVFTGLAAGALAAGAFRTGAAAADADDRVIYNSATGALFFDADGNGAGAAVQFATLSTGLAMTAGEFVVI